MHPDNDKMMEKKPIIIYWENFSFFFFTVAKRDVIGNLSFKIIIGARCTALKSIHYIWDKQEQDH